MGCGQSKKKLTCVKPEIKTVRSGDKKALVGRGKWPFNRAQSERYDDLRKKEKNIGFQDGETFGEDIENGSSSRNPSIISQTASTSVRLNSGITVNVNLSQMEESTDINCVIHKRPLAFWCIKCEVPICNECLLNKHSAMEGHVTHELSTTETQIKDELKKHINRLSILLAEVHLVQMEIYCCKQNDEKLAQEFVVMKQNSCAAIERLGQQIEKKLSSLKEFSEEVEKLSSTKIYQTIQNVKNNFNEFNDISEWLKSELESYKMIPKYTVEIDNELVTSVNTFRKSSYQETSPELSSRKIERFLISDIFRSNYPLMKGKHNYSNSMKINCNFEHLNPEIKTHKNDPKIINEELKNHMRKFLTHVTPFNARFKAQQFFQIFSIRISNVNLITDAVMDIALTSDLHGGMSSFLAYLIGTSAKTIEWHFAADNIPSYLMERCQDELQKELQTVDLLKDEAWLRYKRLVRFIGELYVCGLLPAALMEYFLDYLLSREQDIDLYGECVCMILLTIGPVCESSERQISVNSYLKKLEEKQKIKSNVYVQHLIQHVREMKTNQWNLKECSGVSNVNNQQTDIILEYLNSIESAALATESGTRGNRKQTQKSSNFVRRRSSREPEKENILKTH